MADFLRPKALNIQNHLVMIPVGGLLDEGLFNWTPADLEPYLFYRSRRSNRKGKMFGGLIFNPISVRKDHYIYPLYSSFGKMADMVDWRQFIQGMFHKGVNLFAAAQANRIIDVWVVIPYPMPFQSSFGQISGQNINFEQPADRLHAVRWWINEFLSRWNQERELHANLRFRGFVWQREAVFQQDISLIQQVNAHIKSKGLYSLWLPNYGAAKVMDWKQLGFDLTCVNPNYYGNTSQDSNWINSASAFAKVYETGLQINCGKGIIFNSSHLIDYLNLGLPQYNGYITDCLLVFQFHNMTITDICRDKPKFYRRLFKFIKGTYTKVSYQGIKY